MRIQLSDHFTYRKLIRFVLPSVVMMVCTSLYSIVDGLFVSNFVGKTPFAAINLTMPLLMGLGSIGFMIGTGGSAIVSKTLGEGKEDRASQYFTLLVAAAAVLSLVFGITGFIFARPIMAAMGILRDIRENLAVLDAGVLPAECISELPGGCRKARIKPESIYNGGTYECGAGLCIYCNLQVGNRRSGGCHGHGGSGWRSRAYPVFCGEGKQADPIYENQALWKCDSQGLRQWLVRTDDQRLYVPGKYAV